jgi:hypothetical protein
MREQVCSVHVTTQKATHLLTSRLSTRSCICSLRMLIRCPPRLLHSISASFQVRRRSSTAVMQNCRIDTHPKPHCSTTSFMGSARYHSFSAGILEASRLCCWAACGITTVNVILLPRDSILMSCLGSPFVVQWAHVDSPSQRRANKPGQRGSGSL